MSGILNQSSKHRSKDQISGGEGDLKSMSIIEELRNETVKSITSVHDDPA